MSTTSFLHVSEAELTLGLEYAHQEHSSARLDRDMLRTLANATRTRMQEKKMLFYPARYEVLLQLPQKNSDQQARRDAYSSAIGKIFSERNRLRRLQQKASKPVPAETVAKPAKKRKAGFPTRVNEQGQLEWLL